MVGRRGSSQPGDDFFLHERDEFALGNDRVAGNQFRKFILLGQRARQMQRFENPIVKRTVHFKFQRADRVRDALDVIAQAMRESYIG